MSVEESAIASDLADDAMEPALFSVATESAREPASEPEAPETTKADRARDESGKFKPKAEEPPPAAKPEEAAKPEKPAEKPDFVKAIIAERRKRQAAEAAAAKPQEAPKTDFLENPDQAFKERIEAEVSPIKGAFFRMSIRAAQATRADYEAAAEAFYKAGEADPQLFDAMRADEDPGEFIYQVGKQLSVLSDVGGDIGKYTDKVKAEFAEQLSEKDKRIAALEADLAKVQKQFTDLSTVRPSLNSTTSRRAALADDDDDSDITRFGKLG